MPSWPDCGPTHPVVQRRRRAALALAAGERDAIPTGKAAVFGELVKLPYLAIAVLVLVTLPRWFFDADAFGGAQGYLLCPQVCADCRGPFRVHTLWHHEEGTHSTSGADYYCTTPTNEIASLSDTELVAARSSLRPFRLAVAPGAATYLALLFLLVPASIGAGVREHFLASARRRACEPMLGELAAAAGVSVPTNEPVPATPLAWQAFRAIATAAALASALVVGELVVHRLLMR